MKTKAILIITALALFTVLSCNKLKDLIDSASTDLADDEAVTNLAFDDVFNTVDIATSNLENIIGLKETFVSEVVFADSCPTITISSTSPTVWPKTITINYGAGCTGFYGSTRSGKIITVLTNRRNVVGSTRTVTFDNYFFNGNKIVGTKVLKTLPLNGQNPADSITLTGGKMTLPNGKTIEHAFKRQRELIAGFNTPKYVWDDEYLITGTATGKGIKGNAYTSTILTALHWTRACEFILSGSIKFERSGVEPVILDYGTGACDSKATLTKGTTTKEISLRHKFRSQ
jgi:hypothetical protein